MNKMIGGAVLALALSAGAAASPPTHDELGLSHKLISTNPLAVEITLRPRRLFDSVAVEAGSGVAAVAPGCAFSAVTEGGVYICRFELTGNPADPAMTVNIVAQHVPAANAANTQALLEIHHLTFKNPAYRRSSLGPSSKHSLSSAVTRQPTKSAADPAG